MRGGRAARAAFLLILVVLLLVPSASAALVVDDGRYRVVTAAPYLSASVLLGYADQGGVFVLNRNPEPAEIAWQTTSDPAAVVSAVHPCPAPTAGGTSCRIGFSGPALRLPGAYAVEGIVTATNATSTWTSPAVVLSVRYCALPPC